MVYGSPSIVKPPSHASCSPNGRVRVGRPRGVAGLGPLASGGGATLAGLVLYAANGSQDLVRGGPAVPESGREQKNDGRIGRLMGYLRKQI